MPALHESSVTKINANLDSQTESCVRASPSKLTDSRTVTSSLCLIKKALNSKFPTKIAIYAASEKETFLGAVYENGDLKVWCLAQTKENISTISQKPFFDSNTIETQQTGLNSLCFSRVTNEGDVILWTGNSNGAIFEWKMCKNSPSSLPVLFSPISLLASCAKIIDIQEYTDKCQQCLVTFDDAGTVCYWNVQSYPNHMSCFDRIALNKNGTGSTFGSDVSAIKSVAVNRKTGAQFFASEAGNIFCIDGALAAEKQGARGHAHSGLICARNELPLSQLQIDCSGAFLASVDVCGTLKTWSTANIKENSLNFVAKMHMSNEECIECIVNHTAETGVFYAGTNFGNLLRISVDDQKKAIIHQTKNICKQALRSVAGDSNIIVVCDEAGIFYYIKADIFDQYAQF